MKLLLLKTYWNLDSQNISISKKSILFFLDNHCVSYVRYQILVCLGFLCAVDSAVKSAVFYQAMDGTVSCSCSARAPKTSHIPKPLNLHIQNFLSAFISKLILISLTW